MTRIKRGLAAHRRHKNILAQTKGFRLGRHNIFRLSKQALLQAGQFSYRDRRTKKRSARRLWIVQLNAAVRVHGLAYKDFIHGLDLAGLKLDRKVLSALAQKSPEEFTKIVDKTKDALSKENN